MKRSLLVITGVLGLLAVWYGVLPKVLRMLPAETVEFQGEQVRLARWYFDYDEYKNDPENINAADLARVQALARTNPAQRKCGAWREVAAVASAFVFPGYGSASLKSDWKRLRVIAAEIPATPQYRVFIFQPRSVDQWCLVDDTVVDDVPFEAALDGGSVYITGRKERLATRTTAVAPPSASTLSLGDGRPTMQ